MGCASDAAAGLLTFSDPCAKLSPGDKTAGAACPPELAQNLSEGAGGSASTGETGSTPVASTIFDGERLKHFALAVWYGVRLAALVRPRPLRLEKLESRRDSL